MQGFFFLKEGVVLHRVQLKNPRIYVYADKWLFKSHFIS